ncbi:unnamed protein product, partial [Owenia fusiformis]
RKINMALNEMRKYLWHAFNTLDDKQRGTVPKSKLKVLTKSIETTLGIQENIEDLEEYHSTPDLNFKDYISYLTLVGVFAVLEIKCTNNIYFNDFENVCWMICSKQFLNRDHKIIHESDVHNLWKLFNFLCECDTTEEPVLPIYMIKEEVGYLLERIYFYLGKDWSMKDFESETKDVELWDFKKLLNVLELRYVHVKGVSAQELSTALTEVADQFFKDVIKKGFLTKKGHFIQNQKDRWVVLTRHHLKYYTGRDQRELKGEENITTKCKVESIPEKGSNKASRFMFCGEDKSYELSAPDVRSKNEWIAAIQSAIDNCQKTVPIQRMASQKRRKNREILRAKSSEDEERLKREKEEMEKTKQQLELEKKKRLEETEKLAQRLQIQKQELLVEILKRQQESEELMEEMRRREEELDKEREQRKQENELLERNREELEMERKRREEEIATLKARESELESERTAKAEVENKLQEEMMVLEQERTRLNDLQHINKQLENLLDQERQDKKDEEIVRALQAKLLEEETKKREELEIMRAEQERLLEQEKLERVNVEEQKKQQDELLEQERQKLEQLELERREADSQLKHLANKLYEAERDKALLRKKQTRRQLMSC